MRCRRVGWVLAKRSPLVSLKVAFVLPSLAGGGAERAVLALAEHLDQGRFLPTLVVLDGRGPLRQAVPATLPVHDLGRSQLRWALPRLARRGASG